MNANLTTHDGVFASNVDDRLSPQYSVPSDAPASWRRLSAKLVDQQLWCFGYDVRRPEGNLLIKMGCERIAAPEARECSSCYQADLPTGERLTLRGFGILCEYAVGTGAVFLHRDGFRVSRIEPGRSSLPWHPGDVPQRSGIPQPHVAEAAQLIARAAEWIADYEIAVANHPGNEDRVRALSEWSKSRSINPVAVPKAWQRLASDIACRPELIGSPRRRRSKRRAAKPLSPA